MGGATLAVLVLSAAGLISAVAGSSDGTAKAGSSRAGTRYPLFRTLHRDSLDSEFEAQASSGGRMAAMRRSASAMGSSSNAEHSSDEDLGFGANSHSGTEAQVDVAALDAQQHVHALETKLAELQERSAALEAESRRSEHQREAALEKQFAELKAHVENARNSDVDVRAGAFQDAFDFVTSAVQEEAGNAAGGSSPMISEDALHFVTSALQEEAGNAAGGNSLETEEDIGVDWPGQRQQQQGPSGGRGRGYGDWANPVTAAARGILSLLQQPPGADDADTDEHAGADPDTAEADGGNIGPVGPPGPPGPKGPPAPEWQNLQGFLTYKAAGALFGANFIVFVLATVLLRVCALRKLAQEKAELHAVPQTSNEWDGQGWDHQAAAEDMSMQTPLT